MISNEPLPEGHTARILAHALTEAGAPSDIIRRAERGYYHDYLSPLTYPEIELVKDLRKAAAQAADPEVRAALLIVVQHVIEGRHDANKAESDDWARSPEGKAAFRDLTRRPR